LAQTRITAILFDLGETLLNFGRIQSKSRLFKVSGRRSYTFLKKLNQPVGRFRSYFWRNILALYVRYYFSLVGGKDFDSLALLEKYGRRRGFQLSREQWEHLNWLWYEPLRQKCQTEPGLVETLTKLEQSGLKMGIVSNTFVSAPTLDRHLDEEGLIGFFDTRIYSCDFGLRKPDKRILLEAARRVGVSPANTIYVGDRINVDVKVARRAGMLPVLKNAYTNEGKQTPAGVERIDSISQLPEIVQKLNS
jgi:HAD superfamily hydrolase (TIGR01549 family)